MAATRLLEVTLADDQVVGSNVRGDVTGAGWLYALPRLGYQRIVCVGTPSRATIAALARAGSVTVVPPGRRRIRVADLVRRHGWTSVTVAPDAGDGAIDLLVILGDAALRRARDADLFRRCTPTGVVFVEASPGSATTLLPGPGAQLRLTPVRGEPRAILPASDGAMAEALQRMGLDGTGGPRTPLKRIRHYIRSRSPARAQAFREAIVLPAGTSDETGASQAVPDYIREIATGNGCDLTDWRWAVAARGDYDSQKILVLLTSPDATDPTGVVKITRSPAHGRRLENETQALYALQSVPVTDGRVPRPWFAGSHAGRALLGESLVVGSPFTEVATWSSSDPSLRDAMAWLTDLAVATAQPVPVAEVAEVLAELLARYARIYRPSPPEMDALRGRLDGLGRTPGPIPSVLQHGDPGIWNLLVDQSGSTVFLDWEASEPLGMPLWDLLYLFRSYAIATGRRSGVRDRLEATTGHMLAASPLADTLVDAVETYRRAIDLPQEAIEPLVYGCWLHRSLKEATRLTPDRVGQGRFVRLIRRMLERPDAPTLVRLFGTTGSGASVR